MTRPDRNATIRVRFCGKRRALSPGFSPGEWKSGSLALSWDPYPDLETAWTAVWLGPVWVSGSGETPRDAAETLERQLEKLREELDGVLVQP